MQAADVKLGNSVTFKKYGAVQLGQVTARRTSETVDVTEYLDGTKADDRKENRKVRFLVQYVMRNGNESRDWMYASAFQPAEGGSKS